MSQHDSASIAFVAGATGYTGRYVVQQLTQRKVRTFAHIRANSSSRAEWSARFESYGAMVDVTPWDQAPMRSTLQRIQPTHVFSLLGTTLSKARADKTGSSDYKSVDYNLTAMMLDAAVAAGSNPCFTFLSSLGASAESGNEYLKVRGQLENMIRSSGLPWLIVQPAIITGPDRTEARTFEPLSAFMLNGFLEVAALFGARRMQARYASMTGSTLASGIVDFALRSDRSPRTGRIISYEDIRGE